MQDLPPNVRRSKTGSGFIEDTPEGPQPWPNVRSDVPLPLPPEPEWTIPEDWDSFLPSWRVTDEPDQPYVVLAAHAEITCSRAELQSLMQALDRAAGLIYTQLKESGGFDGPPPCPHLPPECADPRRGYVHRDRATAPKEPPADGL